MSVLEVRDLTIALPTGGDRREAAARVSFTVDRGEIVCLVGESGSGKSVIAQAIMGLLPQALPVTGGAILLEGEDIVQAGAERLRELRGAFQRFARDGVVTLSQVAKATVASTVV